MNRDSVKGWLNTKNIFLVILGIVVVYISFNGLVNRKFSVIEDNIRAQANEQQLLLTGIAVAMSRNGADETIESVIVDCTNNERNNFNNLLSRLDQGLTRAELVELERLFGRCGSFSSERKSVMATRLLREIDVYETYIKHLALITDDNLRSQYNVDSWKALAVEEEKQSRLFAELVTLQDRIITTLLDGKLPTSPEITEILEEVSVVQENLQLTTTQANEIRNKIISI